MNNKIVQAVEKRNASCFQALQNQTDRTTDAWTTCMFEGLLGNRKHGAPALAGSMLNTFTQVGSSVKILDLWVGAFDSGSENTGGCPAVASNNSADSSDTPSPYGIKTLSLYMQGARGAVSAKDLTNRNSADAKAMVMSMLYSSVRSHCDINLNDTVCELPKSILGGGFDGDVVTSTSIAVNTMFGQVSPARTACVLSRHALNDRCAVVRRLQEGHERQCLALRGRLGVLV